MTGDSDPAGSGTVHVEDRGPVRWVVLNRPSRHNAIDLDTAIAWAQALGEAASASGARAVVLAGEGRSFCAGGDLKAFRQAGDRRMYLSSVASAIGEGVEHIKSMGKPVIAAVHGNAMGVGFSMFLAADYKMVAENTKMAMSYVNVGLSPGGGGTWLLSRIVGMSKAIEMILLGDPIGADEALDLGIIDRVVSPYGVREAVQKLGQRFAGAPAETLARPKALMWSAHAEPLDVHLAREAEEIGRAAEGPEFEEGSLAFFERRPADF